MTAEALAVA